LFFLDEVTALAAGHRPCFECRRRDANTFAENWATAQRMRHAPSANEIDEIIHRERISGRVKLRYRMAIDTLPDGAMVVLNDHAYAVRGEALLRWTLSGYRGVTPRPRGVTVEVLTPPSIVETLKAGFAPRWHRSAAKR
jgi:hypothetical protein